MSVKLVDNTSKIDAERRLASALFLRYLLDDIDSNARPITPYSGNVVGGAHLRDSTLKTVQGLHGQIAWVKEYAAAQEQGTTRGFPIRNYTTPGTGKGYAIRAVVKAVRNAENTMRKAKLT